MSAVPFIDLGRAHEPLQAELAATFERIARSGAFTLGAELEEFEATFAGYCGAAHCVGTSDGTEALRLALVALGAGPGREVVSVPSTFIAAFEAIAATGARPALVDIDPATRCMDPERLAAMVGPETAAVMPVHLYGRPAPMPDILAACDGVPVLEDAAQAHGYPLSGAAAAFSFYPTKNLGALGDGGAVVTDDADLAAEVRSMRHHGHAPGDANAHVRVGATSRLDNLQAALLSVKLPHLDRWNEQRREAAARYRDALSDLPVELPPEEGVFYVFAIELDDRDHVRQALREAGIGTGVHYPRPAHLNPAWSHLGSQGDFPAAERLAERTLSLPMFPGIQPEEIERVAAALRAALA
ncbi:MAG: DegT/DnrJ/EryC1/StrS family aminotransferase [Thermoleophilaceae bacterium]